MSAVLLEPVQGEGGVNPATAEYFAAVRRICDERGLLFMVDEVQTGFGRTGEWFGFQHLGVQPDVVTMAKALGNGVPIGACWARARRRRARSCRAITRRRSAAPRLRLRPPAPCSPRCSASTHPRSPRAAGARLTERLGAVSGVKEVRGLGLLIAVELESPDGGARDAKAVADAALSAGLVVNAVTASALRLAPPLNVSDAEIDEAVEILANVLKEEPS